MPEDEGGDDVRPRGSWSDLHANVSAWYARRGRDLAIRGTRDPYAILVAEVMAQQTQISRVEPAWRRFLERFPTVHDLATASPADVIRQWAGLGYNGRAVRLRQAAVEIVERHEGEVPRSIEELAALPGVGPYTARAVAATAFGRPVAPVDTNVRRVVGRVVAGHGHHSDPGAALPPAVLQAAADEMVLRDDPALWTHALMDLGASVCRPVPRCGECPARSACAFAAASQTGSGATSRAAVPRRGRVRAPQPSFEATTRWLRGRLLHGLREAPDGTWQAPPDRVGGHGPEAIAAALAAMARDGLVEWDGDRVRLPAGAPPTVARAVGAPVRP